MKPTEPSRLVLEHVGPIQRADVEFGDLTVLVGPQASGKSIFLQMLNLTVDIGSVLAALELYGIEWPAAPDKFLEIYLGEGMGKVWENGRSSIAVDGKRIDLRRLLRSRQEQTQNRAFYVPAHRAIAFQYGWPRPFVDYRAGDPFAVRFFSERIRRLLEAGEIKLNGAFPRPEARDSTALGLDDDDVFKGFGLSVDRTGPQKRIVLRSRGDGSQLPFMVWSTGQREFVPLLLALDWLLPRSASRRRGAIDCVLIEEPEMGLHPQAISSTMLRVLQLLRRGYRVCLSTHSPRVLDVIWALKMLREGGAKPHYVLDLFDVKRSTVMEKLAKIILAKTMRVYYFGAASGQTADISNLDPGAANSLESGWGGLIEPSDRRSVSDIVSEVVTNSE